MNTSKFKKRNLLYILLACVLFVGCTNPRNVQNDIIIVGGKTYEMDNRFAEGYWFISVDTTQIDMTGRRVFVNAR